MGSWHVRNLRLRERLAGSNEWEEFEATSVARPLLDGMGNEDEFRTDHDGGFIGMSFRFFDAGSSAAGRSTGPTAAAAACSTRRSSATFDGDVGVFEGEDTFEGRPILVRFYWSGVTTLDAALGAVVLGRRRRDLGDELGDGVHAGRGCADERPHGSRRQPRLPAREEVDRAGAGRRARRATRP